MDTTFANHTQMAPFSFPNPFRSTHCLNHAEQTPPSSPEPQEIYPVHRKGRLPLSKFFKKPRSGRPAIRDPSPPMAPLPWTEPWTEQYPLSFIIPASPPSTEYGSVSGEQSPSLELRRRSCDYTNLRAVAQQQKEFEVPRIPNPLLPSPLEPEEPSGISGSYFDFKDPRPRTETLGDPGDTYASYEDLRILSCYYGKPRFSGKLQPFDEDESEKEIDDDVYDQEGQFPDRSTICSVESDWFAGTKSYDERLRRFRQRCFQVVQHPRSNGLTIREDEGHEIKLATVLIGPGKPKLVQVHRPPSASKSSLNGSVVSRRPETPKQLIREISAFSPYDTPMTQSESRAPETAVKRQRCSSTSTLSMRSVTPAPLSIPSYLRMTRFDSAVSMETCHRRIYESPSRAESQFTLTSASTVSTPLNESLQRPFSPAREVEASFRCWKLERTLDSVTRAIESFPHGILRLDSQAIHELRYSNITDETHITCLQKIFPRAATLLLSALAAWIILDLYLLSLDLDTTNSMQSKFAAKPNESLHRIPAKARATLGISLSELSQLGPQEILLRKRALLVQASGRVISQRLMEALRGSWDEDLWRSLRVLVEVVEDGAGRIS